MKKKLFAIILLGCLIIMNDYSVKATEKLVQEARYDLELGGTQEFVLQNENEEKEIVIVEQLNENGRIAAGTYRVTHKTSAWAAGFTVKISNNLITSTYSPFYSVESGRILNTALTQNSSVKATYSFQYKRLLLTWNTGVIAQISEGDLVVLKK